MSTRVAEFLGALIMVTSFSATAHPVATASTAAEAGGEDIEWAPSPLDGGLPSLEVYGFADFGFQKILAEQTLGDFLGRDASFAVGNFNLYLRGLLAPGWESLGEVRFHLLPNGLESQDLNLTRTDTRFVEQQYANPDSRWGGIEIERLWLQREWTSWATLRAGLWLTPYGIWNVDHGSPVIIGVAAPFVVRQSLFPERQTGLQLLLRREEAWGIVGLNLTLSNGRGPVSGYWDLDRNKGVGGRLWAKGDWHGPWEVGVSGYFGGYTDLSRAIATRGDRLEVVETITEAYDELALAVDAKWLWNGWHLQAEFVHNARAYRDAGRPEIQGTGGRTPDHARWGGYAIVGYRFGWLGLMPFSQAEVYDFGVTRPTKRAFIGGVGVNVRPTAEIVVKTWVYHGKIDANAAFPVRLDGEATVWEAQVAWAF